MTCWVHTIMNFKEWLLIQEMGYYYDPKDSQGKNSVQVRLPALPVTTIRMAGEPVVTDIDMRFEDYGFPGSSYFPWYAVLPSEEILSSYESDHRWHRDWDEFSRYRSELDERQKRPLMWKEVSKTPRASEMAKEEYGFDNDAHPWWDFAEGSTNNKVTKPGLYRVFQQQKVKIA